MIDLHAPLSTRQPLLPVWGSIILYFFASFFVCGLLSFIFYALFDTIRQSDSFFYILMRESVIVVSLLISVYSCAWIFLRHVNRLPFSDLGMSIKGRWKDCLAGVLFPVLLYAVGFGISLALNAFDIVDVQFDASAFFMTILFYFMVSASEEIMVRGYIQGMLMTKINKFMALIIASVLFSVLHGFNPGIGFLPLLNLFIAGLLLGASYMYTRNLWFPIFLHTIWNWVQGSVLGYKVSGTAHFPSVLQLHWTEDNLINGGQFGFEGSVVCTILSLAGTVLIIFWYERDKKKTARH